jgi:hypothetical protein
MVSRSPNAGLPLDTRRWSMTSRKQDEAPESVSTIAVLHQHSLSPSLREKIVAPFIVLVVGAILLGAAWIVRDHVHQDYRKVGGVKDVLILASRTAPASGGIGALVNPSDDQYVSFATRGWQFWEGKSGMTEDHYLRLPDLQAASLEQLVKGERGAASLLFRIDLGKSEGSRFQVASIDRGGMESGEPPQVIEIYAMKLGQAPLVASLPREGAYVDGKDIAFDRTKTFNSLQRVMVTGRLERSGEDLRIAGDTYKVVLSPEMDPGLRAILEDVLFYKPQARIKMFVDVEEIYPWEVEGEPARRQTEKEIGRAHLQGVQLGKVFVVNGVRVRTPTA